MLEEINLAFLSLNRTISIDITTLTRLRFLNLSNNDIEGNIFEKGWENLTKLEIIELQYNVLTGSIPNSMRFLPELIYLNFSFNKLQGPIKILTSSQKLQGLDFSNNEFTTFPWGYFEEHTF